MIIRLIFVLLLFMLSMGCAPLGIDPPNFQDGTWSNCTYSKKGSATFTGPLQLGGAPLEFTEPDGTKVKCGPMPKTPEPAPTAK